MGDPVTAAPNSDLGPLLTEIRDSIKEQNAVLARLVDALTRKYEENEKGKEKEPEVQVDDTVPVYPKKAIGWDSDDDEGYMNKIYIDSETSSVHHDMFEHPVYGSRVVPFRTDVKPTSEYGYVKTDVLTRAAFNSIKFDGPQPQDGCFLEDWKYCKLRLLTYRYDAMLIDAMLIDA